ncbi:MAG: aminopeptidase P family protein [Bacteroidetes bacterium]|nr:aminopeptidase P family protein [Bacteroidota bacterium]MCL5027176.1 aminopeptidase P family protein [Chloroflexota bacterium]
MIKADEEQRKTVSVYAVRIARLREKLAAAGLDALLVTRPENRRYLSGHRSPDPSSATTAGWLLVGPARAMLLTDCIEYEAARQQVRPLEVVQAKISLREAMAEALLSYRRVGFEESHLVFGTYRFLAEKTQGEVELVPVPGMVEELRIIKDESEHAAIRKAAALTDQALAHVLAGMRPGTTEREVAWGLECWMREHGAEGMAFRPIVASGPNAALPHAGASERPIAAGDPVVIDIGARLDGYCGDLTRSFCLRKAGPRYLEVYRAVGEAQQAALSTMRAGVSGKEIDTIARERLMAAGYGEAFGHSLGHGVGLVVHEGPRLAQTSTDVLAEGMVVTVEPGVYLPGWGGVRTEDLVIVRKDGVEVLSGALKEPVIKGVEA